MKQYRALMDLGNIFYKGDIFDYDVMLELFTDKGIKGLIANNILEEIKEPEFTRDQMIHFKLYDSDLLYNKSEKLLDEWIKKYKK